MVVEKKGEYAKGEKRQEKYNQIKENLQKKRDTFKSDNKRNMGKTDVQERDQKRRMSPKNRIIHTKKAKLKKKTERRTNMQKHTNLRRCPTKR